MGGNGQPVINGGCYGKVIMTVDGNTAAAYTAYAFTQAAAIYPDYTVIGDGRNGG